MCVYHHFSSFQVPCPPASATAEARRRRRRRLGGGGGKREEDEREGSSGGAVGWLHGIEGGDGSRREGREGRNGREGRGGRGGRGGRELAGNNTGGVAERDACMIVSTSPSRHVWDKGDATVNDASTPSSSSPSGTPSSSSSSSSSNGAGGAGGAGGADGVGGVGGVTDISSSVDPFVTVSVDWKCHEASSCLSASGGGGVDARVSGAIIFFIVLVVIGALVFIAIQVREEERIISSYCYDLTCTTCTVLRFMCAVLCIRTWLCGVVLVSSCVVLCGA